MVLISFAEILGHLMPKNARFCRFCAVKRSKSAQNFLARFARQFFYLIIRVVADFALQNTQKVLKFFWRASRANFFRKVFLATFSNLKRCFLFRLPNFQIGAGCFLLRGGGLNSNTPVLVFSIKISNGVYCLHFPCSVCNP